MQILDITLGLMALIVLEIVLGIDNLVFLSILTEKLPMHLRKKARRWGLTFAWVTRLILLASAIWLTKLTKPLIIIAAVPFSVRDMFLILGGIFLITKATQEIHNEVVESDNSSHQVLKRRAVLWTVVAQVALMDIIFSLDSVLTAIGLTDNFWIMALAITIAILVMIFASEQVSAFITKYASLKMLALSFLMLIGVVLVADGFSFHVPRGYIYFAMGFSLSVEMLNLYKKSGKKR